MKIAAVYEIKVTVRSEEANTVTPPTLDDVEKIVEGAVSAVLAKQRGGIDHALFEVNAEASRDDR